MCADLRPLRSLKELRVLDCAGCPIESLEPRADAPLRELHLDYRPQRDEAVLKRMKGLRSINRMPVEEFWRRHHRS